MESREGVVRKDKGWKIGPRTSVPQSRKEALLLFVFQMRFMCKILYKELTSTVGVWGCVCVIDLVQLTHFIDEDMKLMSIVQNNTMDIQVFEFSI